MSEVIKKTVEDKEFVFTHVSVRKLNKLFMRIIKLAGKPLSKALKESNITSEASTEQKLGEGKKIFSLVINELNDSLDIDEVDSIIQGLFEPISLGGVGPVLKNESAVFGGSLLLYYKLVYAALEVYFGDFIGAGLDTAKSLQANPSDTSTD